MNSWVLERYIKNLRTLDRTSINTFPFRVGRKSGLPLKLVSAKASREHAEIFEQHGLIYLRDLGSTNGSFINTRRVRGTSRIKHGDILHFADCEFRLMQIPWDEAIEGVDPDATIISNSDSIITSLPVGVSYLGELFSDAMVYALYQPVVDGSGADPYGYEILGRGSHPQLPAGPGQIFSIAESIGEAVRLSEMFRYAGISNASSDPVHRFFFNIHPEELNDYERLMGSLERIRKTYSSLKLVLEVHEQAVTDLVHMKQVKQDLSELDIELAYDDFGAGQARLLELIEVPPHYLKFDMALIRGIDKASQTRLDMIRFLVEMAQKIGSKTLAECVETKEEVEVCKDIGFDFYQGYFFGKPAKLRP